MNAVKNLLLLIISLLIVVVLAEFTVRIALSDITSTSNMQSWFGVRWKDSYVSKNSLGYREREFQRAKPEGVYRIALLGDSFGFGQGLPVEQRFSNLVEAALLDSGMSVELLNFSIPGAASLEQIATLQNDVLPLDPDFILLQWLPNDFQDQSTAWHMSGNEQAQARRLISDQRTHRNVMRKSALYFLLNSQWMAWVESSGNRVSSYEDNLLRPFADPGSEEYKQALQPLIDLLAALRGSGKDFALILHPMLQPDLLADYPQGKLHEVVLIECQKVAATCLDMTEKFRALGSDFDMTSLWVNRFDRHPDAEANRIVAEFILEELAPGAWGYAHQAD